jgi:hypothetical protein
MTNPTFSRLAGYVRDSQMPAELKNKLLLLFYRLTEAEQELVAQAIERHPANALPLFAEFITELEQGQIKPNDSAAIQNLLEKYLSKMK